MIDVTCPGCGAEFTTDDEFAGQKTTCPECDSPLTIPQKEPETPAAPQELRLENTKEKPAPPTPEEPAAPAAAHVELPPRAQSLTDLDKRRRGRARMVAYFRIALAILVSLALVEIFALGVFSLKQRPAATPQQIAQGTRDRGAAVAEYRPEKPTRPAAELTVGEARGFTLAILMLAMLALAVRLLLRAKILDALYVASDRWNERTLAGVTFHFLANALLVGILAWTASTAKLPAASDGMVCGLLGAWLIASSLVSLVSCLSGGREYPHLTGAILNDGLFGLAVIAFLVFSHQFAAPLSRFAVVGLALLLNSSIAFTVCSRFALENERTGRFGRRFGFLLLSILLILALGYVCVSLEAHSAAALAQT